MNVQERLQQVKKSKVVLEGHWEESTKLASDAGKVLSLLCVDDPDVYHECSVVHELPFWVEFWRCADGLQKTVGLHQVQKLVARHRALLLCLVQAYWCEDVVQGGGLLAPQQVERK